MISDRDRRVLADIERQMRAHDPELCDRLSGGGGTRLLHRATSTPAIVCGVLALFAALLLGLLVTSLFLFVGVIGCAAARLYRDSGGIGPVPGDVPPDRRPPFGPPPSGPR